MKPGLILASILGALAAGAASAQTIDTGEAREQQWIYREFDGSGSRNPSASFLSWNYASVVLHTSCPTRGTLELAYFPDTPQDGQTPVAVKQMGFERNGKRLTAPAVKADGLMQYSSSFPIDEKLLAILKPDGSEMTVDALNETEEPWYVGDAKPLFQAAEACR